MESHYFAGLFSLCVLWKPSPTHPVVQGLLVTVVLSLPGPSCQSLWGQALFSLGLLIWPKMSLVLGIPCWPRSWLCASTAGVWVLSLVREPRTRVLCCTVKNILKINFKKMSPEAICFHYGTQQRKPRWWRESVLVISYKPLDPGRPEAGSTPNLPTIGTNQSPYCFN